MRLAAGLSSACACNDAAAASGATSRGQTGAGFAKCSDDANRGACSARRRGLP
jgi:hypothetical protein